MISPKSFEPLIWSYKFGSWSNILPYYWNQNEGRLFLLETQPEMRKKYKFWKTFAIFNISIRVCAILSLFILMKFGPNVQTEEIILLIFVACILLMSTPIHVLYFSYGSRFVNHLNALLQLNRDLGMYNIREYS